MSGIKWQKAKAIWSKKGASLGWKADTWPKRMAPWQLAVLQYPSEVNRSDAKSCKKAIEAAIKSGQVMHVVRRFELPSYVMHLDGTKRPVEFQDLPAIAVNDFSQWLQSEGEAPSIHIQAWIDAIVPAETKPQAAPFIENDPAPLHLLATPAQLIAVFGIFTGMDKKWFNNAKDSPRLMAARHIAGIGGRKGREPLYFVFQVMQWLIDAKRRKGKPMQDATGWRVLQRQFPRVYEEYQDCEPKPD